MKKIILASNSPRRKEILQRNDIEFITLTAKCAEINERIFNKDNLTYNSKTKAYSVLHLTDKNSLIIAADTVVVFNNMCLFKPQSFIEAIFMLRKLSNNTHKVVTSHTILDAKTGRDITELSVSFVEFRKINLFEIIFYILSKNPLDKAGSYGIQDFIDSSNVDNPPKNSFIRKIIGSYYNVVGLDIDLIQKMLLNF